MPEEVTDPVLVARQAAVERGLGGVRCIVGELIDCLPKDFRRIARQALIEGGYGYRGAIDAWVSPGDVERFDGG